ncbi:hypothetical protein PM8797T_18539 [Gimesia maris DSM 8797]|nr:hypothetical protein PM8797T_18539 [Gimesia maris DSM 8797]
MVCRRPRSNLFTREDSRQLDDLFIFNWKLLKTQLRGEYVLSYADLIAIQPDAGGPTILAENIRIVSIEIISEFPDVQLF